MSARRTGAAAFVPLLLLFPALAYEAEQPARPEDGASVGPRVEFFIAAEGGPRAGERYRIEVSRDGFDTLVLSADQGEDRKGWVTASFDGVEGFTDEQLESMRGIYYRVSEPLAEGEYAWRVLKSTGTSFEPVGDELTFRVDTTPPASIDTFRLQARGESVELSWDPVWRDADGNAEDVAGYRVYRYVLRRKFPSRTAYMLGETTETRFIDREPQDAGKDLVFYKVCAVDGVGNEEGRPRPRPFGQDWIQEE